jgi:hypothetical protein
LQEFFIAVGFSQRSKRKQSIALAKIITKLFWLKPIPHKPLAPSAKADGNELEKR